jgi:hypothetical protein
MRMKDALSGEVRFGEVIRAHGLGVVPLLSDIEVGMPNIFLLDEGLNQGVVRISETGEAGEVPFLHLENNGENPLLVLEGEEIVGGKQNRVVNVSIVVMAGITLKIPVSCMEAGRWNYRGENFESGNAVFRAKSRVVQKASVSMSLRSDGSYGSDQHAVWREVSDSLKELGVDSATSDFRAGRERVAHKMDDFVRLICPVERQIGAIFLAPGKLLGCELLATHDLFQRSFEKIVRSFAFEVLSSPDLGEVSIDNTDGWWMKVLDAPVKKYASPGAGEDMRVEGPDLVGSGICWNGSLLHFSCFPVKEASTRSSHSNTGRVSITERRRRMQIN